MGSGYKDMSFTDTIIVLIQLTEETLAEVHWIWLELMFLRREPILYDTGMYYTNSLTLT